MTMHQFKWTEAEQLYSFKKNWWLSAIWLKLTVQRKLIFILYILYYLNWKCMRKLGSNKEKSHLLMDKTNTCVVKGKGEGEKERREKTSCTASSSYSFSKVHAWLQMLTPAIFISTANSKVFRKSIIFWVMCSSWGWEVTGILYIIKIRISYKNPFQRKKKLQIALLQDIKVLEGS